MYILLDKNNVVVAHSVTEISYGIWDEPNTPKWKINDNLYVIDPNITNNISNCYYSVQQCSSVPSDYLDTKYKYINNEFILNTNYKEPSPSIEESLEQIQLDQADILYELTLLELGLNN